MELNRAEHARELYSPAGAVARRGSAAEPRLRIVAPDEGLAAAELHRLLPGDVASDEALIAAVVAGEAAALGALYDRHAQVVFSLLVRIVGDRGTAEDLVQEVFLRAWQQANAFDETRGTVRCWMLGIAHNLALNELRRRRRRPQLIERAQGADDDGDSVYSGCVDPTTDPAADACSAVRDAGIAGALAQLPAGQRVVLTMYAAGFSQTEIATKLGEPLGTIKSRMRRALCSLRETLPTVGVDAGWPVD